MIPQRELDVLWVRSDADLRSLAAHIAGILAHRHGGEVAANVYLRIVGAPLVQPAKLDG